MPVGLSVEDICNMALGYSGVNSRITSIADRSPQAEACATYYEKKRDQLLGKIRPNFAVTRKILSPLAGVAYDAGVTYALDDMAQFGQNVYRSLQAGNVNHAPNLLASAAWWQQVTRDGYGFVYPLPDDCITPIAAWEWADVNGNNAVVFDPKPKLGFFRTPRNDQRVPYALENADDGTDLRVLLSDLDTAVLKYVKRVTNTAVFPDLFVEALAAEMAPALVAALRSDVDKAKELQGLARIALGEAWALGNREQQEDPEPRSEFEMARED